MSTNSIKKRINNFELLSKNYAYWVIISSILMFPATISCNLFSKKEKSETPKSYNLPDSKSIESQEKQRLSNICAIWYDTVLQKSNFNGGIIIAKSGQIIFEKYNGIANHKKKDSITANTSLHIASVSKTFTAMAVLKLWQDKLINIDDEFSKYFPEFNYPGITIKNLLTHRSGLPNYMYFMDDIGWNKKRFVSNQDIFDILISKKNMLKKVNPPNKNFAYCNTNYALLALLVEKVSKMPFQQFLKKNIFDPLQMTNTFVYSDSDSAKTNPSYNKNNQQEGFTHLDKVYGDKNVFSTPNDLLKWDRLLRTDQFLSKAIIEESYKPYSNEKEGIRNYGLGWRMLNYPNGKKIIYHNGWWHGSNAVFIRIIDEDATIIVIGNKYDKNIYKAKQLVGLFYEGYDVEKEKETE